MEQRILDHPWPAFVQPESNGPQTIAKALLAVLAANCQADSNAACDRLLYAVGNNHAGTYWPVILEVLPFIDMVLRTGDGWPRRTAVEAMVDWCLSFWPEQGFECIETPSGQRELLVLFRAAATRMVPALVLIAAEGSQDAALALSVVECLRETDRGALADMDVT